MLGLQPDGPSATNFDTEASDNPSLRRTQTPLSTPASPPANHQRDSPISALERTYTLRFYTNPRSPQLVLRAIAHHFDEQTAEIAIFASDMLSVSFPSRKPPSNPDDRLADYTIEEAGSPDDEAASDMSVDSSPAPTPEPGTNRGGDDLQTLASGSAPIADSVTSNNKSRLPTPVIHGSEQPVGSLGASSEAVLHPARGTSELPTAAPSSQPALPPSIPPADLAAPLEQQPIRIKFTTPVPTPATSAPSVTRATEFSPPSSPADANTSKTSTTSSSRQPPHALANSHSQDRPTSKQGPVWCHIPDVPKRQTWASITKLLKTRFGTTVREALQTGSRAGSVAFVSPESADKAVSTSVVEGGFPVRDRQGNEYRFTVTRMPYDSVEAHTPSKTKRSASPKLTDNAPREDGKPLLDDAKTAIPTNEGNVPWDSDLLTDCARTPGVQEGDEAGSGRSHSSKELELRRALKNRLPSSPATEPASSSNLALRGADSNGDSSAPESTSQPQADRARLVHPLPSRPGVSLHMARGGSTSTTLAPRPSDVLPSSSHQRTSSSSSARPTTPEPSAPQSNLPSKPFTSLPPQTKTTPSKPEPTIPVRPADQTKAAYSRPETISARLSDAARSSTSTSSSAGVTVSKSIASSATPRPIVASMSTASSAELDSATASPVLSKADGLASQFLASVGAAMESGRIHKSPSLAPSDYSIDIVTETQAGTEEEQSAVNRTNLALDRALVDEKPKCFFGHGCTNAKCNFQHPWQVPCKFGVYCTRGESYFLSACRVSRVTRII
jgi:hypothetical protein